MGGGRQTRCTRDPERVDHFGQSVALSGGTIVVGNDGDDDDGSHSGSVYVFAAPPSLFGDANRDGRVDIFDIFCVLVPFLRFAC